MFEFAWPWLLLALPLPWVAYRFFPARPSAQAALLVPFFDRAQDLLNQTSAAKQQAWLRRLLALALWACLVVAAARPQWVGETVSLPSSGRDLLLAVDISGSMQIEDMPVNGTPISRIAVIKNVVGDFVVRRQNDRLGLVLFGTQAYLQAPLTFDRQTVNTLLQEAQLGFAGEQTAIGDAIGLSIKRLKNRPAQSRVIILLTDGANTAGELEPRKAADLAKQAGVKIYTVGIGANEMIEPGFFGMSRKVNPSADLDEGTLTYIADTTGGKYFRAHDPQELAKIYQELDQLEPIEQEAAVYRPRQVLFFWPLGAAMGIGLLLILMRLPLWRRFIVSPT
ncbi:MAG TPA: VWA domain-containing protein [Cellvibrionaceae bacterium]